MATVVAPRVLFARLASDRSHRKRAVEGERLEVDEGARGSADLLENKVPGDGHGRSTGGQQSPALNPAVVPYHSHSEVRLPIAGIVTRARRRAYQQVPRVSPGVGR